MQPAQATDSDYVLAASLVTQRFGPHPTWRGFSPVALCTSPRQHLPDGLRISQAQLPALTSAVMRSGIVVSPLATTRKAADQRDDRAAPEHTWFA
jgi:hypothetical protein